MATADEVRAAAALHQNQGCSTTVEEATTCCYAVQDKVWVDGPDGARWEIYTVLGDAESPEGMAGAGMCCTPASTAASGAAAPTCC